MECSRCAARGGKRHRWANVDVDPARKPEVGNLSHYLQGFSTIPGGAGFLPSKVFQIIYPG